MTCYVRLSHVTKGLVSLYQVMPDYVRLDQVRLRYVKLSG
jgi:hypothetical protein